MAIKTNKIQVQEQQPQPKDSSQLSKGEIEFLLSKMKTAQFYGAEFEQFYTIYTKLSKQLEKK